MSVAAPAINPCPHMRKLVHRFAEGTLAGILQRYASYHIRNCARCRKAVEVLKATLAKLRTLREPAPALPTERWASIEQAWLDQETTSPP